MKKLFGSLLIAPLLLFGILNCASMPGMPGHIKESTSKFDNSKQMVMEPAWVGSDPIKFGLFKNSNMPKDIVVLDVIVKGVESFATGKSLHFNIDGQFYSFGSIDEMTDYEVDPGWVSGYQSVPTTSWSSKRYIIKTDFLNQMINGEKVMVKVSLEKKFIEGEFSSDVPTSARPAFRTFYEKLQTF